MRPGGGRGAIAVPSHPRRARLGGPRVLGDELRTVDSPYPDADGRTETLIAMPALDLDVALVHLDIADVHGNAAYTGVDPYFDDLFCGAARRRFVEADRVVDTAELVESVEVQRLC